MKASMECLPTESNAAMEMLRYEFKSKMKISSPFLTKQNETRVEGIRRKLAEKKQQRSIIATRLKATNSHGDTNANTTTSTITNHHAIDMVMSQDTMLQETVVDCRKLFYHTTSDFGICTDNNKDNKPKVDNTKKQHPCAENDAAVKTNEREAIEKLQVEHVAIVLDLQTQHEAEVRNLHLYYEFRIGELHMDHAMMVSTLQRNHEILVGHLRDLNYTQGIRQEAALRSVRELKNKTIKDHLQEIQSMRLKYDNKLKEYEIPMKGLNEENELFRTEHESVVLDLRGTSKVFKVNMKASMECLPTESNAAMEMLRYEFKSKMKISSPFLTKQNETRVEGIRRKLAEKKQQRSIIATRLKATNSHGDTNANTTTSTITNHHAIDMVMSQDTMLQETVVDCRKLFYHTTSDFGICTDNNKDNKPKVDNTKKQHPCAENDAAVKTNEREAIEKLQVEHVAIVLDLQTQHEAEVRNLHLYYEFRIGELHMDHAMMVSTLQRNHEILVGHLRDLNYTQGIRQEAALRSVRELKNKTIKDHLQEIQSMRLKYDNKLKEYEIPMKGLNEENELFRTEHESVVLDLRGTSKVFKVNMKASMECLPTESNAAMEMLRYEFKSKIKISSPFLTKQNETRVEGIRRKLAEKKQQRSIIATRLKATNSHGDTNANTTTSTITNHHAIDMVMSQDTMLQETVVDCRKLFYHTTSDFGICTDNNKDNKPKVDNTKKQHPCAENDAAVKTNEREAIEKLQVEHVAIVLDLQTQHEAEVRNLHLYYEFRIGELHMDHAMMVSTLQRNHEILVGHLRDLNYTQGIRQEAALRSVRELKNKTIKDHLQEIQSMRLKYDNKLKEYEIPMKGLNEENELFRTEHESVVLDLRGTSKVFKVNMKASMECLPTESNAAMEMLRYEFKSKMKISSPFLTKQNETRVEGIRRKLAEKKQQRSIIATRLKATNSHGDTNANTTTSTITNHHAIDMVMSQDTMLQETVVDCRKLFYHTTSDFGICTDNNKDNKPKVDNTKKQHPCAENDAAVKTNEREAIEKLQVEHVAIVLDLQTQHEAEVRNLHLYYEFRIGELHMDHAMMVSTLQRNHEILVGHLRDLNYTQGIRQEAALRSVRELKNKTIKDHLQEIQSMRLKYDNKLKEYEILMKGLNEENELFRTEHESVVLDLRGTSKVFKVNMKASMECLPTESNAAMEMLRYEFKSKMKISSPFLTKQNETRVEGIRRKLAEKKQQRSIIATRLKATNSHGDTNANTTTSTITNHHAIDMVMSQDTMLQETVVDCRKLFYHTTSDFGICTDNNKDNKPKVDNTKKQHPCAENDAAVKTNEREAIEKLQVEHVAIVLDLQTQHEAEARNLHLYYEFRIGELHMDHAMMVSTLQRNHEILVGHLRDLNYTQGIRQEAALRSVRELKNKTIKDHLQEIQSMRLKYDNKLKEYEIPMKGLNEENELFRTEHESVVLDLRGTSKVFKVNMKASMECLPTESNAAMEMLRYEFKSKMKISSPFLTKQNETRVEGIRRKLAEKKQQRSIIATRLKATNSHGDTNANTTTSTITNHHAIDMVMSQDTMLQETVVDCRKLFYHTTSDFGICTDNNKDNKPKVDNTKKQHPCAENDAAVKTNEREAIEKLQVEHVAIVLDLQTQHEAEVRNLHLYYEFRIGELHMDHAMMVSTLQRNHEILVGHLRDLNYTQGIRQEAALRSVRELKNKTIKDHLQEIQSMRLKYDNKLKEYEIPMKGLNEENELFRTEHESVVLDLRGTSKVFKVNMKASMECLPTESNAAMEMLRYEFKSKMKISSPFLTKQNETRVEGIRRKLAEKKQQRSIIATRLKATNSHGDTNANTTTSTITNHHAIDMVMSQDTMLQETVVDCRKLFYHTTSDFGICTDNNKDNKPKVDNTKKQHPCAENDAAVKTNEREAIEKLQVEHVAIVLDLQTQHEAEVRNLHLYYEFRIGELHMDHAMMVSTLQRNHEILVGHLRDLNYTQGIRQEAALRSVRELKNKTIKDHLQEIQSMRLKYDNKLKEYEIPMKGLNEENELFRTEHESVVLDLRGTSKVFKVNMKASMECLPTESNAAMEMLRYEFKSKMKISSPFLTKQNETRVEGIRRKLAEKKQQRSIIATRLKATNSHGDTNANTTTSTITNHHAIDMVMSQDTMLQETVVDCRKLFYHTTSDFGICTDNNKDNKPKVDNTKKQHPCAENDAAVKTNEREAIEKLQVEHVAIVLDLQTQHEAEVRNLHLYYEFRIGELHMDHAMMVSTLQRNHEILVGHLRDLNYTQGIRQEAALRSVRELKNKTIKDHLQEIQSMRLKYDNKLKEYEILMKGLNEENELFRTEHESVVLDLRGTSKVFKVNMKASMECLPTESNAAMEMLRYEFKSKMKISSPFLTKQNETRVEGIRRKLAEKKQQRSIIATRLKATNSHGDTNANTTTSTITNHHAIDMVMSQDTMLQETVVDCRKLFYHTTSDFGICTDNNKDNKPKVDNTKKQHPCAENDAAVKTNEREAIEKLQVEHVAIVLDLQTQHEAEARNLHLYYEFRIGELHMDHAMMVSTLQRNHEILVGHLRDLNYTQGIRQEAALRSVRELKNKTIKDHLQEIQSMRLKYDNKLKEYEIPMKGLNEENELFRTEHESVVLDLRGTSKVFKVNMKASMECLPTESNAAMEMLRYEFKSKMKISSPFLTKQNETRVEGIRRKLAEKKQQRSIIATRLKATNSHGDTNANTTTSTITNHHAIDMVMSQDTMLQETVVDCRKLFYHTTSDFGICTDNNKDNKPKVDNTKKQHPCAENDAAVKTNEREAIEKLQVEHVAIVLDLQTQHEAEVRNLHLYYEFRIGELHMDHAMMVSTLQRNHEILVGHLRDLNYTQGIRQEAALRSVRELKNKTIKDHLQEIQSMRLKYDNKLKEYEIPMKGLNEENELFRTEHESVVLDLRGTSKVFKVNMKASMECLPTESNAAMEMLRYEFKSKMKISSPFLTKQNETRVEGIRRKLAEKKQQRSIIATRLKATNSHGDTNANTTTSTITNHHAIDMVMSQDTMLQETVVDCRKLFYHTTSDFGICTDNNKDNKPKVDNTKKQHPCAENDAAVKTNEREAIEKLQVEHVAIVLDLQTQHEAEARNLHLYYEFRIGELHMDHAMMVSTLQRNHEILVGHLRDLNYTQGIRQEAALRSVRELKNKTIKDHLQEIQSMRLKYDNKLKEYEIPMKGLNEENELFRTEHESVVLDLRGTSKVFKVNMKASMECLPTESNAAMEMLRYEFKSKMKISSPFLTKQNETRVEGIRRKLAEKKQQRSIIATRLKATNSHGDTNANTTTSTITNHHAIDMVMSQDTMLQETVVDCRKLFYHTTSDFGICTDNNKDNKPKVDNTKKQHPCAENDAAVKTNEREAIEKLQVEHVAIVLDLQTQHEAEVRNLHLYYEFRIGELHMDHAMMVSTLQRNHEILVGHLRDLNYTQGIRQEAALRSVRELKNKTIKDHLQEIQSMRLKYDNKLKEYEIPMKGLNEENELFRTEHESVVLDLRGTSKVFKVNMKASMECLPTESNAAMEMLRYEFKSKMKISSPFLTKQNETRVEGIRRKLAEKKQQRSIIATRLKATNSHGDTNANTTTSTITNHHAIDMVMSQDTMLQETVVDCRKLFYHTTSDFGICTDNNKDNKPKVDNTKKQHPCAENDAAVKTNEREAIEKLQVEHVAIVLDLQTQHEAEVRNLHLYYEFRIGELHMDHAMMVSTLQRNHEILVGHLRDLNYTQGIRQEAALRSVRELKNKTIKDHLQEIQSMRLKYDNKLKEYEIPMKGLNEENELFRTEHESVVLDLRGTSKVFKVNMKASMECLPTESNAAMEMLRYEFKSKMKISSPFLTKQNETRVEGIRRELAEKKQQRSIIATRLKATNSHGDTNANTTTSTITNHHAIDMVMSQDTMLQETVVDCRKLFYHTVHLMPKQLKKLDPWPLFSYNCANDW
ncbi:hypothetical protein QTP88_021206 [Uroleucon formosanum]